MVGYQFKNGLIILMDRVAIREICWATDIKPNPSVPSFSTGGRSRGSLPPPNRAAPPTATVFRLGRAVPRPHGKLGHHMATRRPRGARALPGSRLSATKSNPRLLAQFRQYHSRRRIFLRFKSRSTDKMLLEGNKVLKILMPHGPSGRYWRHRRVHISFPKPSVNDFPDCCRLRRSQLSAHPAYSLPCHAWHI
jgi:hypothetical protein